MPPGPVSLRATVSLADGEEAAHRAILGLCNEALGWGASFEDVEFSKISGGISNILVKVTPKPRAVGGADPATSPAAAGAAAAAAGAAAAAAGAAAAAAPDGGAPPARARCPCWGPAWRARRAPPSSTASAAGTRAPVAVKVFGEKTELLVNRDAEVHVVVALSELGFGPKVLALFGNGRIEEFLHCMTLTPEQMCDAAFIPRIAGLLARFHRARPPLPRRPEVFPTIRRWLGMARALEFDAAADPAKAAGYAALDFDAMEREVDTVEAACAAARSPLVWAHCDLLSGNFLVLQRPGFDPEAPDPDGPMTVIDFEYGAYAERGYDFGNHFNEYAGFECDYSRYPDREKQALFFSHYFGKPGRPAKLAPRRLEALCAEANVFALASHIYWGVWSVVQARYSPIDFDYLGYHHLRFNEYRRRKEEFLSEAARVFGSGGAKGKGKGGAAADANAAAAAAEGGGGDAVGVGAPA